MERPLNGLWILCSSKQKFGEIENCSQNAEREKKRNRSFI